MYATNQQVTLGPAALLPPETWSDGYMEVVTTDGGRSEREPCKSFTGVAEYLEELRRVVKLRIAARKAGEEWEPVSVQLVFGDFEHASQEIR